MSRPTDPARAPVDRLHVTMREPATTFGGVHSYVHALTAGQRALGLVPHVADRVTGAGTSPAWEPGRDRLAPGAVVHLHFAHAARPWLRNRDHRAEAARAGARTLVHFHGPWAAEAALHGDGPARVWAKRLYERDTYRRARCFVAASDAFAAVLVDTYGVDPGRVRIVAPAVDTDRFALADDHARAAARDRLGLTGPGPVFLTVRRLEHRMGLDVAVRALATLPRGVLLVAGTGPVEADLRALAASLGVADRVRFLGAVPDADLPATYAAADVVVVPTRGLEGFGIVVLEALAVGRPVVATRVGGLPDALGPFAADLLVDPERVDDLAAAMAREATAPSYPATDLRAHAETRSPAATARRVEEVLAELA